MGIRSLVLFAGTITTASLAPMGTNAAAVVSI